MLSVWSTETHAPSDSMKKQVNVAAALAQLEARMGLRPSIKLPHYILESAKKRTVCCTFRTSCYCSGSIMKSYVCCKLVV